MSSSTVQFPIDAKFGDWNERLQPARVLEVCREQLERVPEDSRRAWRECRMIEALYHPGRYLRVAYVLLDAPATPAHRQWPEGQIVYLNTPLRAPMSRRGTVLSIDGGQVEAYRFPNDRRLRGLRTFAGRDDTIAAWQRWIDESTRDFTIRRESLQRLLVRYVPEQKWVIRLRAEGESGEKKRRIAVRFASPDSCAELELRHRQLAKWTAGCKSGLVVPPVIGADIKSGLLAVEWLRGESLVETLRSRPADVVLQTVAEVLASFHRLPAENLAPMLPEHLTRRVREAVDDLSSSCPALAPRLESLAHEFEARLRGLEAVEPVTLHNDFHCHQFSIKRDRYAMLDLERMCLGDPSLDVVNFTTHLRMLARRPEPSVSEEDADRWARSFLEEWAAGAGRVIAVGRFAAYAVLSLLELARGSMRHFRPGWETLTRRCVEQAESELTRAGQEAAVR